MRGVFLCLESSMWQRIVFRLHILKKHFEKTKKFG